MWITYLLGLWIRYNVFDVNNGNEDKENLIHTESYDVKNVVNVYFPSMDTRAPNDRIGGWFIRTDDNTKLSKAKHSEEACKIDESCGMTKDANNILKTGKLTEDDCVFILLHGNAKNRGAAHRIAAYKIFQSLGCYTLTMDYRGYGDSIMSWRLNETTVVEDALAAIKLLRDNLGEKPKLILYGHSMGTGIAAHAAALSHQQGLGRVDGLILDSPFHSFKKAFRQITPTFLLPYIDIEAFVTDIDMEFDNVKWLSDLQIPVRVFHATSDNVTPLEGAKQLVEDVQAMGKSNIDIVIWEEEALGHIGISKTKTFRQEIKRFMQLCFE